MKKLIDEHSNYIGTPDAWVEFINCWDSKRAQLNLEEHTVRFQPSIISKKTIGSIAVTENRLNISLPKSYKDFIIATNSQVPNWFLTEYCEDFVLPIEKIDWLKNTDSNLVFEAYIEDPEIQITDEEYYCYDVNQDEYLFRREYLKNCLKLNYCDDDSSGYKVLLNTNERTKDSEMEAWHFYAAEGFTARYKSFAEMIVTRYILDIIQKDASMHYVNLNDDPYGYSKLLIDTK